MGVCMQSKRISVSLPVSVVDELDSFVAGSHWWRTAACRDPFSRSHFIEFSLFILLSKFSATDKESVLSDMFEQYYDHYKPRFK